MSAYVGNRLRTLVTERASGQCEYCLIPLTTSFVPHHIDHIIAQKHGGPTISGNLALTCAICNRFKGSDLVSIDPQTDEIVRLFHPRKQNWSVHFSLRDGLIFPLTAAGRVTVKLLQLNLPERVEERQFLSAEEILNLPSAHE
jgi:5-methylcytosine-specific restriction endonuclease McrA